MLKVDEELLRALETKEWGRPLALGTVVRDAMLTKDLIPVQEFLGSKESIYRKTWNITPWNIVSWGLRQLGLAGGQYGEDTLPVGKLAILSNIELASKKLAGRVSGKTSRTERIYSRKLFRKEFANVLEAQNPMSEADVDILLKFLMRDKGTLAYDGQTIKFRGYAENETLTITSEDTTIASLKTLMSDLESQISTLTRRVEVLSGTAKDAVSRNNRVSALAALRSKKLAESNLSRQSVTLGQLEEVYSKIGQAADHVELIRILQGSTGVLKAFHTEMGGVERVDDVVDELKEQMTQVEEIGNVINEVGEIGTVDEDEVDLELKAMEQQDTEKREESERLEKQRKELEEAAETKRKLDHLEAFEGQVERKPLEQSRQGIVEDVNESTGRLGRLSIAEHSIEETAH